MDSGVRLVFTILSFVAIGLFPALLGMDGIANILSNAADELIVLGNFLLVHDNALIVAKLLVFGMFGFFLLYTLVGVVAYIKGELF